MIALVDTGFLVGLLSRRDAHHTWAADQAARHQRPWRTCEPVLTEAFHLLGSAGASGIAPLLQRGAVVISFSLAENRDAVIGLMRKYSDIPMSLADACLVRMTEMLDDPVVITTDGDFRVYRRHSRQVVPCVTPD